MRENAKSPIVCSILELVQTPVVKQSLLWGTAHCAACLPAKALVTEGGTEVPPRKFGKAAACPVAPPKADGIGEPHR